MSKAKRRKCSCCGAIMRVVEQVRSNGASLSHHAICPDCGNHYDCTDEPKPEQGA